MTAGLAVAALGSVARRYRRDLRRARERVASIPHTVHETPFGQVEYAQTGSGPSVLIVHGVLGGFDFGVDIGRANMPPGYRVISPSRFGFLGSPMPPSPSPAAQADAFAVLLDHLGIDELPVVAFSAGSTSAIQLALRHPERVSRLLLISPNAPHPVSLPKPPRILAPLIFSDLVFGIARILSPSWLENMSGTPKGFIPNEREQSELRKIVESFFPVSPRARGTTYDAYAGNLDIETYPLEHVAVPTLVIAAEDDTLAPYADSRAMAYRIPGSILLTVPRGGHALTHLDPAAHTAITHFLADDPAVDHVGPIITAPARA